MSYTVIDKKLTSDGWSQCYNPGYYGPGNVDFIYTKNGNILDLTVYYADPNSGVGGKDGYIDDINNYTISIPDSGAVPL